MNPRSIILKEDVRARTEMREAPREQAKSPLFKMSSTECQNECRGHTLWLFLCHISYEVPRGSIVVEKD